MNCNHNMGGSKSFVDQKWRDEFCFPVLHDYVEEQRRVMFLQT